MSTDSASAGATTSTAPPTVQELPHLKVSRWPHGVVLLTLDNPDQRNAMSDEMTDSWVEAITALRADRTVRVVVVTGQGSAFCSGGDLSWLASEPDATVDALRERMLPFYRRWLTVRTLEVPTIAAINGPAIGAGLCLPLACDLRYAADTAKLGVPFTKLGLHPGMSGTYLLPEVVGQAAARELFLTGRLVQGEEAVRLGLVTRTHPAQELLAEVLAVADQIAANAPIATRLTTMALRSQHSDQETALQWEGLAQPVTMATEDLLEGITAAQQKRPAVFRGR